MNLVHRHASTASLRAAQALVVGLWLFKTGLWSWDDLAELPLALFQPVGLHRWLPPSCSPWMLAASGLAALRWLAIGLLLATTIRRVRPYAFVGAGIVLLHFQALQHGFGFVNHQEMVPLYALFVFGICAWGRTSWDTRVPGLPILAILVMLCLVYSIAGVYRVVRHPELFSDPATMVGWVLVNSARPLEYGWAIGLNLPWSAWLAWVMHVGFIGVTVLEIGAPLALVWRPFRIVFLAIMPIPFHVTCLLLMNIFFWENGVLMLLFLDAGAWWTRWAGRRSS